MGKDEVKEMESNQTVSGLICHAEECVLYPDFSDFPPFFFPAQLKDLRHSH